jgi:DNA-binding CsgD family transcriptional regulator
MRATSVAFPGRGSSDSFSARASASRAWLRSVLRPPLFAAVAMFVGVFLLRLEVQAPETAGICLLFTAPIALLTLSYGFETGLVGATVGLALLVFRTQVQTVHVDVLFFATRAFAFYALPLVVALARSDSAARTPSVGSPPDAEVPGAAVADQTPASDQRLTRRELEVLGLVAAGSTNAEIAEMLFLSIRTVESHRASLLRKLGRPSREELVAYARDRGLAPVG